MSITVKDIGDIYGSLNDIEANPGPSGDRRVTMTTDALSQALASIYTPDALKDKNTFLGIVLISYPTKLPRQGSKQELFHSPKRVESDGQATSRLYPYYDVYKVYIPELEPIPLNWDNPTPGPNEMTLQQRVMTFDDIIPSNEMLKENPGPIAAGTIVAVQYEDMSQLKNPRIVGINGGGPAFDLDLRSGKSDLVNAFNREGASIEPSDMSWANRAKQQVTEFQSSDPKYSSWNGTVMRNGELHLEEGFFEQHEGPDGTHCQLMQPAYRDWQLLASAYENKWGEELHGSGYRPYNGQVHQRMLRVKGDRACSGVSSCFYADRHIVGEGAGKCNENCKDIGVAAVPGTSPHGWGAAVDLYAGWAFPCARTGHAPGCSQPGKVTNKKWIWLNKFGERYNYVFNVTGEHWHLGWIKLSAVTSPSISVHQSRWDETGLDDDTVEFGPGPDIGLLQLANETEEETKARIEEENEEYERLERENKQKATERQIEELEALEQEQAAQQLQGLMACTEEALINAGASAKELSEIQSNCRIARERQCNHWLQNRTQLDREHSGPVFEGSRLDCSSKPWAGS